MQAAAGESYQWSCLAVNYDNNHHGKLHSAAEAQGKLTAVSLHLRPASQEETHS